MLVAVAPKVDGIQDSAGKTIEIADALYAAPSILFDGIVVAPAEDAVAALVSEGAAIDWLRDAFGHLKAVGYVSAAQPLLEKAGIVADEGVVEVGGRGGIKQFIDAAKGHRIWEREPTLRHIQSDKPQPAKRRSRA